MPKCNEYAEAIKFHIRMCDSMCDGADSVYIDPEDYACGYLNPTSIVDIYGQASLEDLFSDDVMELSV